MRSPDTFEIDELLAIVEACLCELFPHDFFRRCAFAAFGLRALLQDAGIDGVIVGGQFAALVVALDETRIAMQGIPCGPEVYPHLWVETQDRLLDLWPHLLAYGSQYPVVRMPVLAWDRSAPLPTAFHYHAHRRLPPDIPFSIDPAVNARCDRFIAECRDRLQRDGMRPNLPTWTASNPASMLLAIERGDPWARAAYRFQQQAQRRLLTF